MQAANVHAAQAVAVAGERGDGRDVPRDQDADAPIALPLGQAVARLRGGREHDFDLGRHAHAIELLLRLARADAVVHEHDELHVERLPPAHDDLAVDQSIVDAIQGDTHAAGVRIARLPASAARRAASAGERSRWNTKSSSIARFTPVTTATSARPRASRTELVRHDPPGRSTKSTAGRPSMARMSRSVSAPVSHPSFETGTRASFTPVIAATAVSNACATAACDTITPRRGSLIVLLEILLQLAAVGKALDQTVVEGACRVHPAIAEQVIHRHDLTDYGEVLARVEGHRDERQRHVEDLRGLPVDAGSVVFARRVPIVELDHDLDAFLLAHRTDAEQGANVDQPDPADLHVMLGQFVPAADQHVVAAARDVHEVVRHQPMATLDEVEHTLALADPRAPEEQQTNAEYVRQRRMHRRGGCERLVEERLQATIELGRFESRANHRHALRARELEQLRGWLLPLGDDDARQVELEQHFERPAARRRVERGQVRDFRLAQDVKAMRGKARRVSREHEPGTRRFRRGDLAVEPEVAGQGLELQRIALALEEIADLGQAHRSSGAPARRLELARRRIGDLSSWRRTLATAASSAVRWSPPRALATCRMPRAACNRTSTSGRPLSATNRTRASCGRGAIRSSRASRARARMRSSSAMSQ